MGNKEFNIAISLVVFIAFILYLVIEFKIPCDEQQPEIIYKGSSKAENDSLKNANAELIKHYEILQKETDTLQSELNQIKQKNKQLKLKQHEAITTIDNFNNDELYRYFTNFKAEDLR